MAINKFQNVQGYKENSSFIPKVGSVVNLQSYNFRDHYVKHEDHRIRISSADNQNQGGAGGSWYVRKYTNLPRVTKPVIDRIEVVFQANVVKAATST